jgi:hypothetical protein
MGTRGESTNQHPDFDIHSLREESRKIATIEKYLKKYQGIEKKTMDSTRQSNKILRAIEKTIVSLNDGFLKDNLSDWLRTETVSTNAHEEELSKEFVNELYSKLREKNLSLEGVLPKLKTSFYTLEIDLEGNKCEFFFGPKEEQIASLRLDPTRIAEKILEHRSSLDSVYLNADSFLKDLEAAYDRTRSFSKRVLDHRVPIIDILTELSLVRQGRRFRIDPIQSNYSSYGRMQFSYDLYKWVGGANSPPSIVLHSSTRAQMREKSDYLWVPRGEYLEPDLVCSYIEVNKTQ